MLKATQKILRLRRNGIKIPIIAYQEAQRTGCNLAALCAVLEQETEGGENVFGHDRTIFVGAGKVTKLKYQAYKHARGVTGRGGMQGVGPMQLTYYSYQDAADKYGGCWKPRFNVRVGAEKLVRDFKHTGSWHGAFRSYNGSESYARQVDHRFDKWKNILK